jgi:RNA polymerase sigma-70 factor (ECF subfamily)
MPANRGTDTSVTLMMRVQQDPSDPLAWDEFVERYRPMITAWCVKWGSQACDAEDVAQAVLLKLLSAMKQFRYDPARSFRAWLKTVTQNAWNSFLASRRANPALNAVQFDWLVDSHDALADLEQTMEDAYDRELLVPAMRRVEKRVKPATWQAFRLTAIENRPGAEVAKELQMKVTHVFVAKHRVQKMLEEEVRILKG